MSTECRHSVNVGLLGGQTYCDYDKEVNSVLETQSEQHEPENLTDFSLIVHKIFNLI